MIAHASIPARDPRATAQLFARLIAGDVFRFPVVDGAWIAVARDGSGLAVEVYPDTMAHHPGVGEVDPALVPDGPRAMPWEDQVHADAPQLRPSAFHFALATPLDEAQIIALAQQAGFRAIGCDRGGVFRVVELWLDNMILIELLPPPEVARYRAFMNPAACAAMFGAAEQAA